MDLQILSPTCCLIKGHFQERWSVYLVIGSMFSLLSGFLTWLFQKPELHILIVGLDHAGKTTFLEQMKGIFQKSHKKISLDKIPPTVGLNIGRMDINNAQVIFWDLGGQIALRSIWARYYKEAHGLLFVLDSADKNRFEEAFATLESITGHPELAGIPLLVCANKQDLVDATPIEKLNEYFQPNPQKETSDTNKAVSASEILILGKDRKKNLKPVSALTCYGIEESVKWLVDAASNHADTEHQSRQIA